MPALESKGQLTFLETEAALDQFMAAMQAGTWPLKDWNHAAHVALAATVAWTTRERDVLPTLRDMILGYNAAQGILNTPDSGYHETLTRFWAETVVNAMRGLPRGRSRLSAVRLVVDTYGQRRRLADERYGFEVLRNREARAAWIGPPPETR